MTSCRNIGAIQQFAYAGLVLLGQLGLLPQLGEEVEPVQHGSGVRSQALEHRNLPVLGVGPRRGSGCPAPMPDPPLPVRSGGRTVPSRSARRIRPTREGPDRLRTARLPLPPGTSVRRERTGQSGGIDHQLRSRSRVGRRSGCIGGSLRLARGLDAAPRRPER